MKKNGFSLAEVLITMAIIAISAAMLTPAYINLKPDRYKYKVLNCYKALNEITEDLLGNSDLYFQSPAPEDNENFPENYYISINNGVQIVNPETEFGCLGLACTQRTALPEEHPLYHSNQVRFSNVWKYPNLLVESMQLDSMELCNNPGDYAAGISSNQIKWRITINRFDTNQYSSKTTYNVVVDMNRDEGPNRFYGQNGEKHPDRFKFIVDTSGDITGGDPLTQQYLRNMTNIRKESDYEAIQ